MRAALELAEILGVEVYEVDSDQATYAFIDGIWCVYVPLNLARWEQRGVLLRALKRIRSQSTAATSSHAYVANHSMCLH